jgi:hypothetical protein
MHTSETLPGNQHRRQASPRDRRGRSTGVRVRTIASSDYEDFLVCGSVRLFIQDLGGVGVRVVDMLA